MAEYQLLNTFIDIFFLMGNGYNWKVGFNIGWAPPKKQKKTIWRI